jgi:hypothetical protein
LPFPVHRHNAANQRNFKRCLELGISRKPTQRSSIRSRLRYFDVIQELLPSITPFRESRARYREGILNDSFCSHAF